MKAFLGFLGLLLVAAGVQAQTRCLETDTFDSCAERFTGQASPTDAAEKEVATRKIAEVNDVATEALALLATKNTGDASETTITDYLPLLRAILDTGGFSQDGEKLGFEWSNPLGLPAMHQNKLTAVLAKAEIYEPLGDALRAAGLEDQISTLEDNTDEGDDITIGFSYSRASERYGRDPELHAAFFSALLKGADIPNQREQQARKARTDFERQLTDEQLDGPFSGVPAPLRAEYIRLNEELILAQLNSMRDLGRRLQKVGFYGLLDLINNQPQLTFSAQYRLREDTVGPDEFKAAVSYEMGWANVNAYRDYERRSCAASEALLCLADYLTREDVLTNLRESRRMSFRAEYSKLQQVSFALPSAAFAFSAEPLERLSITASFGRYLGQEAQSRTRARIEASLSYEDFSDDPARQNRGLASATFTYPVSQGFFLSLGAVYATKPEFRGDVDSELSAKAGFTYKLVADR
jgi:hypothetical protein